MKSPSHRMIDEEEYYSLTKSAFHMLAPFYDTVTAFDSALRNKVVDFAGATNG